MKPKELIEQALESGQGALNEADSKRLLSVYGIPVIDEAVCVDPDEAATRADEIGFPVVLKGLGPKLTHKTERGLVRLGLHDPEEIIEAARRMADEAGDDLEGWLVQPQVSGRRELVAGLFRDEQFGPVVMFGLGGIFTEILRDTVFRVAPLEKQDALDMMQEIKARKILEETRGMAAVDKDMLAEMLITVGRIGIENDRIKEIDINPVIISGDKPVAVDALIVLQVA